MLDPTQKYECDAGEVIALHGPDTSNMFAAIIKMHGGALHTTYLYADGTAPGTPRYTLRPARPKLHVKCWLVVWNQNGPCQQWLAFDSGEKALEYAQGLRTGGYSVAILPIDTTLTAGDGMEEQS
jgi:hypothetical protein